MTWTPDDSAGRTQVAACNQPTSTYLRLFARLTLLKTHGAVSMSEDSALIRQWRLLKLLSSRHYGATVKELAEEMRVNEKTIRRDLQTFEQVGFPLEEVVGERGRKSWKVRGSKDQPELNFALDEALALYMGRRFLEPLAGTFFWDAAQSAFKKIRACLGKTALEYLERIAGRLHHRVVGAGDYSKKADLIDALMQAIEDHKQTFITYRSQQATEPVSYPVYPYGLTYFRGSLYLVAHAPDHEQIRHYKIDRVEDVDVTALPFNRPGDFDLEKHLAGSFGVFQGGSEVTVKVRFAPAVARYVEESRWHGSQQLAKQKDGTLTATFRLSNTEEISRWILSFGKFATVVEPEELRDRIAAEAEAILANHRSPAMDGRTTRRARSAR
jgi:predicted DNA-binding transcriptional regulator YafY